MNCKKVNSGEGPEGYDYFQNLPDELLILIFTKLSDAQGHDTLTDVKLLGQCSTVSKRFNSLAFLVPTLYISHLSLVRLCRCCYKMLKKFKHIRSLRLEYQSDTKWLRDEDPNEFGDQDTNKVGMKRRDIDHIYTTAIYDAPGNYSLAILTCTSLDFLLDQRQQYHPMRSRATVTKDDRDLLYTTLRYGYRLLLVHQRVLSLIQDLKLLQTVVVTDFTKRESFTLVGEQLVQSREKNNAQVQGCHKNGFYDVLSMPSSDGGVVLFKNISFGLFMRSGANSTRNWDDNMPQFVGNTRVMLQEALTKMLKMKAVCVYYEELQELLEEMKYWT